MNDSNNNDLPVKHEPLLAGGAVKAIVPQSFEDAFRIGRLVVAAGMAPAGLETAEKCTIAIMHGLEVGLTPLQAIQRIAVINGRPTIWGDAAIGLVRASGKCRYVKEWIDGVGDDMTAHCETLRVGETEPVRGSFSVADAKRAGLWMKRGKQGQDTPWITYPKRMLQMRARAFPLRDSYADVLGGLYLREEFDVEMKDVTPQSVTPPPPPGHPAPPPDSPLKRQLSASLNLTAEEIAVIDDEIPKDGGGDDVVRVEEPSPGEFVEVSAMDPDAYLDDLDQQMSVCKTTADLDEVWKEHMALEDTLFPPDRDKAQFIFERHDKRIKATIAADAAPKRKK